MSKLFGLSEIIRVTVGGDKKFYTGKELVLLLNEVPEIDNKHKPLKFKQAVKVCSYLTSIGWASKRKILVGESVARGGRMEYTFKKTHNGMRSHPARGNPCPPNRPVVDEKASVGVQISILGQQVSLFEARKIKDELTALLP
jgi:hypothetical protein